MKNLQISEVNARKLYQTAAPEFKQTLEDTFGKAFFSQSITERVKTYEDACAELGEMPVDDNAMLAAGFTEDEITYRKLKTITKALNEGWYPDWSDGNEKKWMPWFKASSGFAFDVTDYCYSYASAGCASRLCFKTEALAEYAGRQFNDLYKAFIQ